MKPLMHGLQEDGEDYLRYLIYWKRLNTRKLL